MTNNRRLVFPALIAAGILWGSTVPLSKVALAWMAPAWLAFARTGTPEHEGLAHWPTWDAARRATMIFGARTGPVDAPRDAELAVWAQYRPLLAGAPAAQPG